MSSGTETAAAAGSSRLRRSTHRVNSDVFNQNRLENGVWYKDASDVQDASEELADLEERGFEPKEVTSEEVAAAAEVDFRPVLHHYLRKVVLIDSENKLLPLAKCKLFDSLPYEQIEGHTTLYSCGVCSTAHRPGGRTCIFYQPLTGVVTHIRRDHPGLHLPCEQTAVSKKYLAKAKQLLLDQVACKYASPADQASLIHPITRRNFPADKLTIDQSSDQGLQKYHETLLTRGLYPMDLGTVYERLMTDQYASVSEAAKDADVATQCVLAFLPHGSDDHKHAESVQRSLMSQLGKLAEREAASATPHNESDRAHEDDSQVDATFGVDESERKESDHQMDISAESSAGPAASPRPSPPPPAEEDVVDDAADDGEDDDAADDDDDDDTDDDSDDDDDDHGSDNATFDSAREHLHRVIGDMSVFRDRFAFLADRLSDSKKRAAQLQTRNACLKKRNADLRHQLAESQKREAGLQARLDGVIRQAVAHNIESNKLWLAAATATAPAAASSSNRGEPRPTSGQKRKRNDHSSPSRALNKKEEGEVTAPAGGPKKRKKSIAPALT